MVVADVFTFFFSFIKLYYRELGLEAQILRDASVSNLPYFETVSTVQVSSLDRAHCSLRDTIE